MSAQNILMHLSLIPGIGPSFVEKFVSRMGYDRLDSLYSASVADLQQYGVTYSFAQAIVTGLADKRSLATELAYMDRYNFSWISLLDEAYPALLRHINLPPLGLYVWGALPRDYTRSLAVVGARQATAYGYQAVDRLIPEVAAQGWIIVSGGALGIDTASHQAAINAGGVTVSVIGSGLLRLYPAQNKKLFESIVTHGGAVVSSFPLTMQALPGNFPARNRIIAGMTNGCLVVQASEKSGALITANYALKEGRDVCAIPGPIFDPLSSGCNRLISKGALLITKSEDIFEMFGYQPVESENPIQMSLPMSTPAQKEHPIVAFCRKPCTFDTLAEHLNCSADQLYEQLWELQIENRIEQTAAGMWSTINK